MTARSPKRILRSILPWLLAWAALTAVDIALRGVVFQSTVGRWNLGGSEGPLKCISSMFDTLTIAGWAVVGGIPMTNGGVLPGILANAIGWPPWFLLAWLLLRFGTKRARRGMMPPAAGTGPDASVRSDRRAFITRAVGVPAVCALGVSGVAATAVVPWRLRVARYTLPIRGLSKDLHGTRLALLTDLHLGRRIPAAHVRSAVELALSLKPDVFLLGGDYIDHAPQQIEECAAMLRPLVDTGRPVLGVLGNHDYYADGPRMLAALRSVGITTLQNQRVFIDASRSIAERQTPGGCVCIAGLDDLWEGAQDFDAALNGVDPATPRLLLVHNPDTAEELQAGNHRVDVMISGHTHGGQVRFPLVGALIVPSRFGQKYVHGMVQGPHFPALIGAGVGMAIVPVRLGVPPEVVEITLTRPTA